MEEKQALDELQFIKKVIQDSQRIIADNGLGYIIWGIIITVGMLIGYAKFTMGWNLNYIWVWVILISLGWFISFWLYKRPNRKHYKVETFAGKVIGRLWFSFGISMTVIGFGSQLTNAIRGDYISGVMAIILGSAYYLMSALNDLNWFKVIGVVWWIGGLVIFYFGGLASLLIMAILMIFGQIVPGIILYRKFKKQCCDSNE